MTAWPFRPGVPAAGHLTLQGWWHPGPISGCAKCGTNNPAPLRRGTGPALR